MASNCLLWWNGLDPPIETVPIKQIFVDDLEISKLSALPPPCLTVHSEGEPLAPVRISRAVDCWFWPLGATGDIVNRTFSKLLILRPRSSAAKPRKRHILCHFYIRPWKNPEWRWRDGEIKIEAASCWTHLRPSHHLSFKPLRANRERVLFDLMASCKLVRSEKAVLLARSVYKQRMCAPGRTSPRRLRSLRSLARKNRGQVGKVVGKQWTWPFYTPLSCKAENVFFSSKNVSGERSKVLRMSLTSTFCCQRLCHLVHHTFVVCFSRKRTRGYLRCRPDKSWGILSKLKEHAFLRLTYRVAHRNSRGGSMAVSPKLAFCRCPRG